MNANPFVPYTVSWGNLVPTTSDELSAEWCKKITALQVRGCGFAGSTVVPLTLAASFATPIGFVHSFSAVASVSLPDNSYGSGNPPMIYLSAQYGSRIYYKQFHDIFGRMVGIGNTQFSIDVPSEFLTWIEDLHYDEVAVGTFRWTFTIHHSLRLGNGHRTIGDSIFTTEAPQNLRGPWKRSRVSHWPTREQLSSGDNKIILHYYALGADPNLVQ